MLRAFLPRFGFALTPLLGAKAERRQGEGRAKAEWRQSEPRAKAEWKQPSVIRWVLFIHFLVIQIDRPHYSTGQPLFNNRLTGAKIRLFFHLTISYLCFLGPSGRRYPKT